MLEDNFFLKKFTSYKCQIFVLNYSIWNTGPINVKKVKNAKIDLRALALCHGELEISKVH